jgi:hypothetical protein
MSPEVNHYPVQPGLYAGEYPGHQSPNVAETRLRELVDRGVQTFIDLTTREDAVDGLVPYEPVFAAVDGGGARGLKRYSFPIPDMGIPSGPELMRGVMDLIRAEIAAGRTCYVHCWGGIGRTGTAVACWLREQGLDAAAALAEVQRLYDAHMDERKRTRYPRSPQQQAQVRYVEEWTARYAEIPNSKL